MPHRMLACVVASVVLAGCATTSPYAPSGSDGRSVVAVASIDAWGSILAQLGGVHARETSIISSPGTDPHDYEPTPADAKVIAEAQVFVENGVGYDSWAGKAVQANPVSGRRVIDVGAVTGTPSDGNPHRWYSPTDVARVADAMTAALKQADPADAGYFDRQRQTFDQVGLARYHQLLEEIRTRFHGVRVGASESIFSPLAAALGLTVITPPSFLKAISEGTEPSAADKSTIDRQLKDRAMAVYVFNSQNATPDVSAQVAAARQQGIPVISLTETLSPAGTTFQDWQVKQLLALRQALTDAESRR